jgi:hypothetical protein
VQDINTALTLPLDIEILLGLIREGQGVAASRQDHDSLAMLTVQSGRRCRCAAQAAPKTRQRLDPDVALSGGRG